MLAKVKIQYGISKLFVQPLTQITNLKKIKAPYYSPLGRKSTEKPMIRKTFLCHDVITFLCLSKNTTDSVLVNDIYCSVCGASGLRLSSLKDYAFTHIS